MAKAKEKKALDNTTEDKIKAAARTVFLRRGFAATRTRDIAEEAGINLALLNYYFRSKGKLFDIIMFETMSVFMNGIAALLDNERSTLYEKVELIASSYIDFISKEPNIPIFMLTEIRNNPELLLEKLPIKRIVQHSVFVKQHQQAVAAGKIVEPNPLHFLMNLLSLIVLPFIARPLLQSIGGLGDVQFQSLMQERKKMIPIWIQAMMGAK